MTIERTTYEKSWTLCDRCGCQRPSGQMDEFRIVDASEAATTRKVWACKDVTACDRIKADRLEQMKAEFKREER